ncbi:hypothetical protein BGZ83_010642 [Gryganskiella cystojenkinii]|nr:hypothetical protein BGZ83_010642 [Gryganskiella cystojenkinii]
MSPLDDRVRSTDKNCTSDTGFSLVGTDHSGGNTSFTNNNLAFTCNSVLNNNNGNSTNTNNSLAVQNENNIVLNPVRSSNPGRGPDSSSTLGNNSTINSRPVARPRKPRTLSTTTMDVERSLSNSAPVTAFVQTPVSTPASTPTVIPVFHFSVSPTPSTPSIAIASLSAALMDSAVTSATTSTFSPARPLARARRQLSLPGQFLS